VKPHLLTVFGSSAITPDDPRFDVATAYGAAAVRAGWGVVVGGNHGLMGAAIAGARSAGGDARIVLAPEFGLASEWDGEAALLLRAESIFHRMEQMLAVAQGFLVLDGGLGSLAELAMAWDLMAVGVLPRRPLWIHEAAWGETITHLQKHLTFSQEGARELPEMVAGPEALEARLRAVAAQPPLHLL